MPYKCADMPIPKQFDRRIKLTDQERVDIIKLHNEGMATRAIARLYPHVSRGLIVFVIYPERLQRAYNRAQENENWRKYYDKKKRNRYMRNHRRYKYKLYKKGKLEGGDEEC